MRTFRFGKEAKWLAIAIVMTSGGLEVFFQPLCAEIEEDLIDYNLISHMWPKIGCVNKKCLDLRIGRAQRNEV